jgi:hypothetical protein
MKKQTLIQNKRATARPKDLADLDALKNSRRRWKKYLATRISPSKRALNPR